MRATLAGRVGLTLIPPTSSSTADATSQVLGLHDPKDSKLSQFRLDPSEYCDYPLAQLYSVYWDKSDRYFNPNTFIHLPSDVVPDGKFYIFSQYSYIERRIDKFREALKNAPHVPHTPPGLALIGTSGIGEPLPIHLFMESRRPSRKDSVPWVLSCPRTYAYSTHGLPLLGRLLHLHRRGCPHRQGGAPFWHRLEIRDLSG